MPAISFADSGGPFDGIRSAASVLVIRLTSSLSPLLPGTTAFDLSRSSRVSSDRPARYLPLVWHSAQRAFKIGMTSWAKSTWASDRCTAPDRPERNIAEHHRT